MVNGPRAWMRLLLTALAAAVTAGVLASGAHADFTASFCNSSPAPPWTEGADGASGWAQTFDGCATVGGQGGAYGFDNATPSLPSGRWAAGIEAPAGEVFTGVSLSWSAEPVTGNPAFITWGYGASNQLNPEIWISHPLTSGTFAAALPGTNEFWARYDCDATPGATCDLPQFINALAIGPISLTVHDLTAPTATATGGSLATNGATVKGAQTLLFHATAAGSGVAKTTVSLGSTVAGESDSACTAASLTPCPGDTTGSVAVNTAAVPDGTYPVILTAFNASGTATPIQAGTVTVSNHAGSTSLPRPKHPKRRGRRRVDIHVVFDWDVQRRTTLLRRVHVGRMSRHAVIHITCAGKRCPFHRLTARARTVKKLTRRLAHRRFRPGETLHYLATAPHRAPQRATMTIRRTRLPKVRSR